MNRIVSVLILALVFSGDLFAQVPNGTYIKMHNPAKRPVSYAHVREADVMWSKRIWRMIDLKEKINHPLAYPRSDRGIADRRNLFDVIHDAAITPISEATESQPHLDIYHPYDGIIEDDEFTRLMSDEEVKEMNWIVDTVTYIDDDDVEQVVIDSSELERTDVVKFKVKEDWIFDKKRSVMEVRIIGIAPVIEQYSQTGEFLGYRTLYWVYFPEVRHILANQEAFNRFNNARRLTFDEVFTKRFFSSTIVKESNVQNRKIKDYRVGLDALLESERITNDLFVFEHDMWEY